MGSFRSRRVEDADNADDREVHDPALHLHPRCLQPGRCIAVPLAERQHTLDVMREFVLHVRKDIAGVLIDVLFRIVHKI